MAFTFIELIVAMALTIVLIRGMYTIFGTATDLTRLSEQKTNVMFEASALSDYIAADVARSPMVSGDYYLTTDGTAITFQASRLDGATTSFARITYPHNPGADTVTRVVEVEDPDSPGSWITATTGIGGEDGALMVVGRHVTDFEVGYMNNGSGSWATSGTLTGSTRTWAIRFEFTLEDASGSGPHFTGETFSLVYPVIYN